MDADRQRAKQVDRLINESHSAPGAPDVRWFGSVLGSSVRQGSGQAASLARPAKDSKTPAFNRRPCCRGTSVELQNFRVPLKQTSLSLSFFLSLAPSLSLSLFLCLSLSLSLSLGLCLSRSRSRSRSRSLSLSVSLSLSLSVYLSVLVKHVSRTD